MTGPLRIAEGFPQTSVADALIDPDAASAAVRAWVASIPEGTYRDSVLLVDLATPGTLSADVFLLVAAHLQWDGHNEEDWAAIDYSRAWIGPWPDLHDLGPLGVAAVVFTTQASKEMLAGNNSPHIGRPQPLPALVVDRDTGDHLRRRADAGAAVGVPHVSGIAGPTYLLKVTEGGEMDKLDADLAARQIAFYADVIRRLDTADATALRAGDPTLGEDGGHPEELDYLDPSTPRSVKVQTATTSSPSASR